MSATIPDHRIRHHFTGQDDARGVYAKEILIPRGERLLSHAHTYDHLSILSVGWVRLTINGEVSHRTAPAAIVIPKGAGHELIALTDVVWFCVHPTDETDPSKVDEVILAAGDE